MDMNLIKMVWEFAPALGAAVAVIVILLGVIGKMFGFTAIGDKSKLVDDTKIDKLNNGMEAIGARLETIERRITTVEHDVEARPTRQEIHALDLSMAKLDGRMGVFEAEIKAVRATVNRIDDFLLAISERSIRDSGR